MSGDPSLKALPSSSLYMRVLGGLFRSIPPVTKGKGRLARLMLPAAAKSRPMLVRDCEGNQMVLPNLVEPMGLYLWMDGRYERDTFQFLRNHVTKDSAFVDVGANIGTLSIPLARYAKQVIAVEPSPQVLPFLRANVSLNGLANVHISACAAGLPGCDSVPLYIPPEDHFGMASSAPQFDVQPITTPARPLDAILRECGIESVSVLKVDAEGYEAHIFLGAEGLLRSAPAPVIIFEFCDWAEERAFPGRKGWAQSVLMEMGYKLWRLDDFDKGGPPLTEPVTDGFHSIVGMPGGSAKR